MPRQRYKPEHIVTVLMQIAVAVANGKSMPQACREARIVIEQWRQQYNRVRLHPALGIVLPVPGPILLF